MPVTFACSYPQHFHGAFVAILQPLILQQALSGEFVRALPRQRLVLDRSSGCIQAPGGQVRFVMGVCCSSFVPLHLDPPRFASRNRTFFFTADPIPSASNPAIEIPPLRRLTNRIVLEHAERAMLARPSKSFVVSRHCLHMRIRTRYSSTALGVDSHTIEIRRTAMVRDFAFFAMAATYNRRKRT